MSIQTFAPIIKAGELAEGHSKTFSFTKDGAKTEGFVIRFQGEFFAYINRCPHTAQPLDEDRDGMFNADHSHLYCDEHAALFNPRTGVCVSGPCPIGPLTKLPIAVQDGIIYLVA
ncbi:MAG: Rieske 2Fe-2S domain-containing protein [Rhizobacter sp.]|nr:Rieske 2Fe-2S domain-containing protein [Chlorobiales bacterium]